MEKIILKSIDYKDLKQDIKKYPNYIDFFSYPFGQPGSCYNLKTNQIVRNYGPSFIFSAFNAPNKIRGKDFLYRVTLPNKICSCEDFRYWVLAPSLLNSTIRRINIDSAIF